MNEQERIDREQNYGFKKNLKCFNCNNDNCETCPYNQEYDSEE